MLKVSHLSPTGLYEIDIVLGTATTSLAMYLISCGTLLSRLILCFLSSPLPQLMEVQRVTKGLVTLPCLHSGRASCFIIECLVLMVTKSIKWPSE